MGRLVLLEASPGVLNSRISATGGRPLLAGSRLHEAGSSLTSRIETLLEERSPVYKRTPLRVDTSDLRPDEAAARIATALELPCHSLEVCFIPAAKTPTGNAAEGVLRGRSGAAHVDIGRGALFKLGSRLRSFGVGSKVFFLATETIRDLYIPRLAASLDREGIPYCVVTIDDREERKNVGQAEEIIDKLIAQGARRDATIVPVGGGVTGDLGGFVASIYMRGVPLVHVPTTLLSQVDSSVGGKVGVNHALAKNLIGSFYQPHVVLIDPCTLMTLPIQEIANGMAEVVKSALIGSASFFEFLESRMTGDRERRLRDIAFLETCVFESTRIKARIVNEDPFEKNLRRTLNLGHTAGHAIEASGRYRGMKHGQAVSIGIVTAFRIALGRRLVDGELVRRVSSLLSWCGLPVGLEAVERAGIRESIRLDKKITQGKIHFVLPTGAGSTIVVDDVSEEEILATLEKGAS
jgi:3-dehydroquinate synthase